MKKVLILMTLLAVATVLTLGNKAHAVPPFEKGFKDMYYKPKSKDANEKKLADAIDKLTKEDANGKKVSCTICHIEGKGKKFRNAYGEELKKFVKKEDTKKEDANGKKVEDAVIEKKITEALKKLGEVKSPAGPKWDEILKKGELPITGEKELKTDKK